MRRYCDKTGKESFRARSEAERALRNMNRWSKETGSVYFCRACQGYHLTHYSYRLSKSVRSKNARNILLNSPQNSWDNNRDNRDNTASIVPRKRQKRGIMDNEERNIVPAIVPKPNCSKSNK